MLDQVEAAAAEAIRARGPRVLLADTVMHTRADKARLGAEIITFAAEFSRIGVGL